MSIVEVAALWMASMGILVSCTSLVFLGLSDIRRELRKLNERK